MVEEGQRKEVNRMNFGCTIKEGYDMKFFESDLEFQGKRSAAIAVFFNGADYINLWFGDAVERAKFVDALLAYQMDYQMTKKEVADENSQYSTEGMEREEVLGN